MSHAAASFTVDPRQSGVRLLRLLEARWPDVARPFLRRLVRDGFVTVNRMTARGTDRVRVGDVVVVAAGEVATWPRFEGTEGARELPVLAESEFCLVVDKPAGIPSIPDRAGKELGVYGQLCELRAGADLRIAHRLDRETSGCLVIAKGLDGARWLDHAFRAGRVVKQYLALVEGGVARASYSVRKSLGPDPRRPGRLKAVRDGAKRSRPAHTDVEVIERFDGFTLLRVVPRTGRSHQIRVHLSSGGNPIVADADYGAERPLYLSRFKRGYKHQRGVEERPLLERVFLHSKRIEVPAPDGATVVAEAPVPADLASVIDKLRRFAPPPSREAPCA